VLKVFLEESAHADIDIIIVWINMLAGDNEEAASNSAKIFEGDQIQQFHDPNQLVGKTIAESLGADNVIAWDMYLFYNKGSKWKERPPAPLDWAHQLNDLWANPSHFAWGDDLTKGLRKAKNRLIES